MSRSNPTDNSSPNPATKWFEWDGALGGVRYYDKADKHNVKMPEKFTFILLDQLATIKGWHDASESGIFSNEVKDTRASIFVVKAFKAGTLVEGFYQNIRDKVAAAGGHFTTNLYIAYKGDGSLEIASLQFKGAALREWMEFSKKNRSDLYTGAITIDGYTEGKKGKVIFRVPKFALKDISGETNETAMELDKQLQEYFKTYFSRAHTAQAAPATEPQEEPPSTRREPDPDDDEIPF